MKKPGSIEEAIAAVRRRLKCMQSGQHYAGTKVRRDRYSVSVESISCPNCGQKKKNQGQ